MISRESLDRGIPQPITGGLIGRVARWVYTWALMRSLKRQTISGEWNYERTKEIINRELRSIEDTVIAIHNYQKKDVEVVADRLARRFDPGLALNEVANRALEAKKEVRAEVAQLSATQLKALEFQKQYLQRLADRG